VRRLVRRRNLDIWAVLIVVAGAAGAAIYLFLDDDDRDRVFVRPVLVSSTVDNLHWSYGVDSVIEWAYPPIYREAMAKQRERSDTADEATRAAQRQDTASSPSPGR
jgi:hypothetical protein